MSDTLPQDLRAGAALPVAPPTDPAWTIVEEGFALSKEHEVESIFAVANGCLGIRGSIAEGTALSDPATFVAGVFDIEPTWGTIPGLMVLADWTDFHVVVDGRPLALDTGELLEHRRTLDLRQGLLWRDWLHRDDAGRVTRVQTIRLASQAHRELAMQCWAITPENYSGTILLESRIRLAPNRVKRWETMAGRPLPALRLLHAPSPSEPWSAFLQTATTGATVAFASQSLIDALPQAPTAVEAAPNELLERWERDARLGEPIRLDRFLAIDRHAAAADHAGAAGTRLRPAARAGTSAELAAHVDAWADRWCASDVQVDGDEDAQRALRFAVYHLVSAVNPDDPTVSVGARALTGEAYRGHVFWDTEIYLLPFYIYTQPAAARRLLEYRHRTLPGARRKAQAMGYRGALYAWESTDTGDETTPTTALTPNGEIVRILTGEQEHHISADVAYAVWQYWRVTGDAAFFVESGAEVLIETARFWASRGQAEADGCYHIRRVIGPDEYHETIDDNAYTNVLARWNLERGADAADLFRNRWPDQWPAFAARLRLAPDEPAAWRATAASMKTGFDRRSNLFEQFEGYFDLEDIPLATFEPRHAPMDIVLQRERLQGSRIVKQADVVALSALLWDEYPRQVHEANFRYYEPRTGHGSSLSPALHALIAARLGDDALFDRLFRQAADIDLANNMGNASGGVHIATLGGLWQAAVLGVAGLRPRDDGVALDPHMPRVWCSLKFSVQWQRRTLTVELDRVARRLDVRVDGDAPMSVSLDSGDRLEAAPGERWRATQQRDGRWSAWERTS